MTQSIQATKPRKPYKMKWFGKTLTIKILMLISCTAVIVPATLVALLAAAYYYLGIESFFNERLKDSIEETVAVSDAYLQEHINSIKTNAFATANYISDTIMRFAKINRTQRDEMLDRYAINNGLVDILLFSLSDSYKGLYQEGTKSFFSTRMIASTSLSYDVMFSNDDMPYEAIKVANTGEVYVLENDARTLENTVIGKVRAIVAVPRQQNMYLLISRYISPEILQYTIRSVSSAHEYTEMHKSLGEIRRTTIITFFAIVISMLTLFTFLAKKIAMSIVQPIAKMVNVTSLISTGDFAARVPRITGFSEIRAFAIALNRMASHIEKQRNELMQAHEAKKSWTKFVEAILSEQSTGVIVVNDKYQVMLHNIAAETILRISHIHDGVHLEQFSPEIKREVELMLRHEIIRQQAQQKLQNDDIDSNVEMNSKYTSQRHLSKNLDIKKEGITLRLLLKFSVIRGVDEKNIQSIVIAFSDLTEVIAMQRLRAWNDVARKVAHEIKNPLTPIQLSVELLQQKFLPLIHEDVQLFQRYISTISARVDDIRIMVNEFLEFARIAAPQLVSCSIGSIVTEAILLQQNAYKTVKYIFEMNNVVINLDDNLDYSNCLESSNDLFVLCDRRQISQVITNLLKNAAEAILGDNVLGQNEIKTKKFSNIADKKNNNNEGIIKINVVKQQNDHMALVSIIDNGSGIKASMLDEIYEPYVTTKPSGTGLGLAIVKKIIEEHKGWLAIHNNEHTRGVTVTFALQIVSRR